MSSVLNTIWTQAKEKLATVEYFTAAPAVTLIVQDEGDIENKINIALGSLGVCCVFLMGGAKCQRPNVSGPYLDNIDLVALISENVAINRRTASYKTALEVAEYVLANLHLWKPATVNEVIVADEEALRLVQNPPPGATLAYEVRLHTSGGLQLA
jgi:hypothetical protein